MLKLIRTIHWKSIAASAASFIIMATNEYLQVVKNHHLKVLLVGLVIALNLALRPTKVIAVPTPDPAPKA